MGAEIGRTSQKVPYGPNDGSASELFWSMAQLWGHCIEPSVLNASNLEYEMMDLLRF